MRSRVLSEPVTYTAELVFNIDNSSDEARSNIASLFGSQTSLISSSLDFTSKDLVDLIFTFKIISKAFFTTMPTESGKEDYLINSFMDLYYYTGEEEERDYITDTIIDPYDIQKNKLLKFAYKQIYNNLLVVDQTQSGFIKMKCTSKSEDFSFHFLNALLKQLDLFYNQIKIENHKSYYEMSVSRSDKLYGQLRKSEREYIDFLNKNSSESGGYYNTQIETSYLTNELSSATEAYFIALRNQEAAYIAYEKIKNTQSLIVVDSPLFPLDKYVPDPFLYTVVGALLGAFITIFVLIGRCLFKDLMNGTFTNFSTELMTQA